MGRRRAQRLLVKWRFFVNNQDGNVRRFVIEESGPTYPRLYRGTSFVLHRATIQYVRAIAPLLDGV